MDGNIVRKISGLLRKAEDPAATEAERDSYNEKAAELMMKYSIDDLMLAAARGDMPRAENVVKHTYDYKGVYHVADAMLNWALAEAFGMKAIQTKLGGSRIMMSVVGFESDFIQYDAFLASALLQRGRATDRYIASQSSVWSLLSASEKYNAKRSFMVGFGHGFADKVAEGIRHSEQEAKVSQTGTAIVLRDKKALVESQYRQFFPRARQTRGVKIVGSHGAGVEAGRRAGAAGGQAIGGTRRQLGD